MHLVIPISHADFKLAVALLRRLASWRGQLQKHHFAILCCWADKFDVEPLATQMSGLFENFRFHVVPDVPEDLGWPDAANHLFYQAATKCYGDPFYFFEADNFPLRPDFLDQLEGEYREAGKPYMGAVEASRWSSPDGRYFEAGKHMVGTGIYPKDFLSVCTFIHTLPQGIPWDVYIEGDVIPDCHETKLIAHRWGTARYKLDGEIITCEDNVVRPGKHSYAKPVTKEAAVIHGCKDLSLYDIDFSAF